MQTSRQFVIKFEDTSLAEANILAESLRSTILDSHSSVSVERRRDDQSAQDFGATLVLLLGPPSVVAVAKGIEQWLKRYQSAKLRIERPDGTKTIIDNVTPNVIVELVKLLKQD